MGVGMIEMTERAAQHVQDFWTIAAKVKVFEWVSVQRVAQALLMF